MAKEMVKVMAMVKPAAVAHQFEPRNRKTTLHLTTKKHKKHKRFDKSIL